MPEADLSRLIAQAEWRVRLHAAGRRLLLSLGAGLTAAAVIVFLVRIQLVPQAWQPALLLLTTVTVAAVVVRTLLRRSCSPTRAAQLLDERAQTHDHLVTWLQLRNVPDAELPQFQREFRSLQAARTAELAARIDPRRLIVWAWPAWSRVVLLAGILLCCAILLPQGTNTPTRRVASWANSEGEAGPGQGSGNGASNGQRSTAHPPQVRVLSPTELRAAQLAATDPELPAEMRRKLLQDLRNKIGNVPDVALTDDVRELLTLLDDKNSGQTPETQKTAGSGPQRLAEAGAATRQHASETGLTGAALEKGVAQLAAVYPDVQAELTAYYQHFRRSE